MSKTEQHLTVSIQAVSIKCPCGGQCINANGAYLIAAGDDSEPAVQCEECDAWWKVDHSIFAAGRITQNALQIPAVSTSEHALSSHST